MAENKIKNKKQIKENKELEKFSKNLKDFEKELKQVKKKIKNENSLIEINKSIDNCWDENKYETIKIYNKNKHLYLPSKENLELKDLDYEFQLIKKKLVSACKTMLDKSESKHHNFTVYNFQYPFKDVEEVIIFLEELMDIINS